MHTVILLGATGRIGNATLKALLSHPKISAVIALTRKRLSTEHPKLKNILHNDFKSWPESLLKTELAGASACIWTLGIRPSLVESYEKAHDIEVEAPISAAKAFIESLSTKNETKFRFIYVSGMASETDTSRTLWFANDARKLKGETENELEKLEKQYGDSFERYIAKSGHVVADGGGLFNGLISDLMSSMSIKENVLAMAIIDIALVGAEHSVYSNSELVIRGKEAIARLEQ